MLQQVENTPTAKLRLPAESEGYEILYKGCTATELSLFSPWGGMTQVGTRFHKDLVTVEGK